MQDGPSQVRQSIIGVRQGTLEKNMETRRKGVSDHHNGHAGGTVVRMTVCRTCPFEDTEKERETLQTVFLITTMVVQDRPS